MSAGPLQRLRDQMLEAPEEFDDGDFPPGFMAARASIRDAIGRLARAGIADETLVAVLMSETLPRLVHERGPQAAAILLAQLAHQIGSGAAPNCERQ